MFATDQECGRADRHDWLLCPNPTASDRIERPLVFDSTRQAIGRQVPRHCYPADAMTSAPPPAPPPLTLDLSQYADAVNNAFYNQAVCVIATSNGADVDLALKGSFMVWDQD